MKKILSIEIIIILKINYLKKVYVNFKPGIPLGLSDIGFSVLTALVLSIVLVWPFKLLLRRTPAKPRVGIAR